MNLGTEQEARQYLINLVNIAKKEANLQGALRYQHLIDPIAKSLGLEVVEEELEFDEGLYIAQKRKIVINSLIIDPDRRNFTFFHEVTHHLIQNDPMLLSFIHEYAGIRDYNTVLERFCNFGAAEFIIPSSEMINIIKNNGFSVRMIEELEEVYPASKPAIATQMAHFALHDCFVVICEYGVPMKNIYENQTTYLQTRDNNISPRLYVNYTARSLNVKYSIARFTNITPGHVIEKSYQTESYISGRDMIPFKSGTKWLADCEALFLKGKVYAAFNLKSPPIKSTLQSKMFED